MTAEITENNCLTIVFDEAVDAEHAEAVQEELFAQCVEKNADKMILDVRNLTDLSGAFLRILFKLTKIMNNNISVVNACSKVYKILEKTGFTDLIYVEKPQE